MSAHSARSWCVSGTLPEGYDESVNGAPEASGDG
jgi:hypothetical protein